MGEFIMESMLSGVKILKQLTVFDNILTVLINNKVMGTRLTSRVSSVFMAND